MCDRQLKRCLAEDVVKEIMGDAHVIEELEKEWEQLQEDRQALRQVFPTGDSKVGVYYLASCSPKYLAVVDIWAQDYKEKKNLTQNKSQTQRARSYKVMSFLRTDCELSTETCSKKV